MDRLQVLGKLALKAGPYLLLEFALPGGTMFALLLYLHRARAPALPAQRAAFAGDVGRRIAYDLERESLTWKTARVAGDDESLIGRPPAAGPPTGGGAGAREHRGAPRAGRYH